MTNRYKGKNKEDCDEKRKTFRICRKKKKETVWGEEWRKYDIIVWRNIANIWNIQESN